MRLLKVVYGTSGGQTTILTEVGKGAISLFGLLEDSPRVERYFVYDIELMCAVAPHQYGWGDLPKWKWGDK